MGGQWGGSMGIEGVVNRVRETRNHEGETARFKKLKTLKNIFNPAASIKSLALNGSVNLMGGNVTRHLSCNPYNHIENNAYVIPPTWSTYLII